MKKLKDINLNTKSHQNNIDSKNIKILDIIKDNWPFLSLIILLIIIVFSNILSGQFLNADDIPGIVNNPNTFNIRSALDTKIFGEVVKAVIVKYFGLSSYAFHTFSLIIHIINTVLFFIFTYLIFGKKVSGIATTLFSVHPSVSEAVLWISGYGYLINAFLTLCILILYTLYIKRKNVLYLISSSIFYLIYGIFVNGAWSLTVFPIIVTVHVLFLDLENTKSFFINLKKILHNISSNKGDHKRLVCNLKKSINQVTPIIKSLKSLIPYLLIFIIIGYFFVYKAAFSRISDLERDYYLNQEQSTPLIKRLPYTVYMTWNLLLVPVNLSFFHEGYAINQALYLQMILFTIITLLTIVTLLRKDTFLGGLIILIFLSILPTFSPVVIAWFIAERYLYIPTGFFCILVSLIILKIDKDNKKTKKLLLIIALILTILYGIKSFTRTLVFQSNKSLWETTVKTAPLSYRVHNNLGDLYSEEGNLEKAIKSFETAIKINPQYADAIHNLAYTHMQLKDYDKAMNYFEKSLEVKPTLYQSLHKMGVIQVELGNIDMAKDYFQRSLTINPNYQPAIEDLNKINSNSNK